MLTTKERFYDHKYFYRYSYTFSRYFPRFSFCIIYEKRNGLRASPSFNWFCVWNNGISLCLESYYSIYRLFIKSR